MKRKWQRMVLLERAHEPGEALPRAGLARLEQIIGDPKADPPIRPLIPVSKSTWWAGVRTGRFPPSIKVTPGVSAWRWEHIHRLLESLRPKEEWTPPGG
jgi:hypothetical protein